MTVGLTDILQVEVRVVLEGLKLAWDRGFRQIELECDSAMLIEFIRNGWASMSNDGKIRGIRGLCLIHLGVKFRHIQGEVNRVAGCVAKANGGMMDQLVILEEPPRYVREFLEDDIRHC
ncbi:hypothetical protein Godav_008252, partial [Gossypium davidsonii]|nr:hypothetical protein [Gossypium davidsonii]